MKAQLNRVALFISLAHLFWKTQRRKFLYNECCKAQGFYLR